MRRRARACNPPSQTPERTHAADPSARLEATPIPKPSKDNDDVGDEVADRRASSTTTTKEGALRHQLAELEQQLEAERLRADVATTSLEEAREAAARDKELFVATSAQTKRLERSVRALNDQKYEVSSKLQKAQAALKKLRADAALETAQGIADARADEAARRRSELEEKTAAADAARLRATEVWGE